MSNQPHTLTWLHISDFHIKDGDPYDRNIVLKALVQHIKDERESHGRQPDLIFATGDIAYSGQKSQYDKATVFFDQLLDAAALKRSKLFVIPGNHDVDRVKGKRLDRTLKTGQESHEFFGNVEEVLLYGAKISSFANWYNDFFRGIRKYNLATTCQELRQVEVHGINIGIVEINSAMFCQGDDDHNRLWVGRRCLDPVADNISQSSANVRIALIHHPITWLHDDERSNITALLRDNFDLILRGHLHETDVEATTGVMGNALHIAAGASYQGSQWPNRAIWTTANIDRGEIVVCSTRYEDRPRPEWQIDTSVFPQKVTWKALIGTLPTGSTQRNDMPTMVGSIRAPQSNGGASAPGGQLDISPESYDLYPKGEERISIYIKSVRAIASQLRSFEHEQSTDQSLATAILGLIEEASHIFSRNMTIVKFHKGTQISSQMTRFELRMELRILLNLIHSETNEHFDFPLSPGGENAVYIDVIKVDTSNKIRDICFCDVIKLKHVVTGRYLHSHDLYYTHEGGSNQQQVTAYPERNSDDYWIVKALDGEAMSEKEGCIVKNNDIIRLEHVRTAKYLHSHRVLSPITKQQEVCAIGDNGESDRNDNWRVELFDVDEWHENTKIRLIHVETNCALHSHDAPFWVNQHEITCKDERDDNDLWVFSR